MSIPTRLVIILNRSASEIQYVVRADVPIGQEAFYATPGATSPTGNTSDPDIPHLVNGSIAQLQGTVYLPQNPGETGAQYKARAQAALAAQQVAFQSRVNAAAPRTFYGAFFDGTTWANSGG